MAVTIESTFVMVDKVSSKLRDIEAQAKLTNKALKDMSGSTAGGGTQGWTRQFSTQAASIGAVTKATTAMSSAADDAAAKTKNLGTETERAGERIKTFTSNLLKKHAALRLVAAGLSTVVGFLPRLASNLTTATAKLLANHSALTKVGGALGGVVGGIGGLVTAFPPLVTAIGIALPLIVSLAGAVGALAGSLSFAAAGGAALGGGLLGSFAVGLGSVVAVAKPAITQLKLYQTAVKQLQTAEQTGSAAGIKAAQARMDAISKANPGVAKLSQNLKGLEGAWKSATAPGRRALFGAANDAIGSLRKQMSWLGPEANKNVGAVADAFKKYILPLFNSKVFKDFVQTLGDIFRKNLPGFAKGLTDIFKGFANILKDLAPQLKTFGSGFERLAKRFDDWTASGKGKKSIHLMGEEFKQWGRILGGVARIIGDLLGAGARSSQKTVKGWADGVQSFADAFGKKGGTKGVQGFFSQSLKDAGKLVKPLEQIAKAFGEMYKVFKPLSGILLKIIGGLPPTAIAGLGAAYLAVRAGIGASKGYKAVTGALGSFAKDRGSEPYKPLFVSVVNALGGSGTVGSLGLRDRFANTGLGKRLAKTKWGGKFLSTAEADVASGVVPEGEAVVADATKGGFLSKILGGGKTLLKGGLRGGATALALSAVPLLAKFIPGGVGRTVNKVLNSGVGRGLMTVGSDAATGAAIGSVIPGVGTAIGAGAGAVVGGISAMGWNPFTTKGREKFVKDMGAAWGAIKGVAGKAWGGIKDAAGTAIGGIKKGFSSITGFLGGLVGGVTNAAKKIGSGVVSGIKSGAKTAASVVSSGVHAVGHAASSVVSSVGSFLGFANGGIVPHTAPILVGEAGPELLHAPAGSRVTPLTGPHAPWPEFGMQTGFPVRLPQLGGVGGGGGIGGVLGSSLGIDLSPTGIGQLVNSINDLTNALTGRNSLQSALQDVSNQFDATSQSAQNDWQIIESASKNAIDNITNLLTTANDTLTKSYNTLVAGIQKAMNTGVSATQTGVNKIFQSMAKAFQTLGVSTSVSKRLSKAGFGKAHGGRLPGEPQGDHLPLYGRGGTLLGIADGGELVVNRHTEKRVDSKLAAYGTTLGHEVAGETRPHYAHGGRIPRFQTGGVVGDVNRYFSGRGWSKAAIAGILGNAMQESGLRPSIGGGGMWQQISNFGSGSGGSLLNQMNTMYPQIASLRASMNSATPAGAATIFEQQFERAGIPALANRIRYAQAAFAGKLGAGLTGGTGTGAAVPHIATPMLGLPGQIGALGQRGVGLIAAAANATLAASASRMLGGGAGGGAVNVPGGAGTVSDPSGKPVAAWIEPILNWARGHGWHGTVESGWRSYAEQAAIYNSGVRPAAVPGTSNHEQTRFPGGAVDVSNAASLSQVLQSGPYGSTLVWAGAKDPVHFSHPHGGSYALGGRIPWFANGTDFIARRPQLIGVGDHPGGERVTVTPQNANSSRPVSIVIHNIVVNRKGDVQKIVDEEMRLLAQSLGGSNG